ncbi:MAG: glycine--tRNA ligase [Candidatus Aenigmatarchaeota archaeon]
MKDLMDIAKRRGFFWPSFEIYGGCSGFYTYGPLGALLKMRIEAMLRDHFIRDERCLLMEAPIVTIEDPWVASGHVSSFTDMTVDCNKCGEAYRADHLLEEKLKKNVEGWSLKQVQDALRMEKLRCAKCGGELKSIYDYNLMFRTLIGPGKNKVSGILRPETAQTTYMPFRRLIDIGRKTLPLGIIQIGKSFRNEISPRKGILRLREFSQAEIQFFVDPKTKSKHPRFDEVKDIKIRTLTKQDQKTKENGKVMSFMDVSRYTTQWIAYLLARAVQLFENMGIDKDKLRCRQHLDNERSFYSSDTWDIEFMSETFGVVEIVGIADRTDYDLRRHMELSKQDFSVDVDGKKVVPHIIEAAFGIDRPLYCVMESTQREEKDRVFFMFPPRIAPYEIAVFPLVRKDKLPDKAKEVYTLLKNAGFFVLYDEGFIGKVYYRQDEAGTPICVTIDYDTFKDKAVTLRDRDTQKQVRVEISKLTDVLSKFFSGEKLEKLCKAVKN